MESLYLLIPLSTLLVLGILLVFAWALQGGQFEDVQAEGERILQDAAAALDTDQGAPSGHVEQSVIKPASAVMPSAREGAH
jgi:cbb3-type cytochrome oxidase maturation protein